MQFEPASRCFPGVTLRAILLLAVCGLIELPSRRAVGQAPVVDPRAAGGDAAAADAGLYLPTDRALSRAMSRVEERLAAGEYHQALTFLQDILSREEDAFLDDPASADKPSGLKTTARRWIGELRAAGREAYETLYGPRARRELDSALERGDRSALAQVVRQYFHTSAGYEAALVLAQIEADHGHPLAAGQLYQELIDAPQAAAQFEPQLSILAALNHLAAGQAESASTTLEALFDKHPAATLQLAGRAITIPHSEGEPLEWLSQLTGKPLEKSARHSDWLTLHGDVSRHAEQEGGGPHLRARWQARVVNDPNLEEVLTTRAEHLQQRGMAAIPAARPIAVGDVVLMRTPFNVVAVDWRTGKRVWETREEEGFSNEEFRAGGALENERDEFGAGIGSLERRIWDDALAMSLSSDGSRVFVIRGVTSGRDDDVAAWQMAPFGGGMALTNSVTNRLAAYDLATQGKLLWELDGGRPGQPFADGFFLGAPLAIDNTLFVLVEIRSAVYLFALDPATGDVHWKQQLVGLETGIGLDLHRRLAGVSPSYAGGILICPTAAGAVIAIDVVKREFAWVYRYPRKVPTPADLRNMWQQQVQGHPTPVNDRWRDSSVRIVAGRVIVTPPESGELYCLDLRTGELDWKHPQAGALFVGAVDEGHVLLVGNDWVSAIRLADGSPAWDDKPVALPAGTLPSGQGYLSDGKYYLPLNSGQVAAIDAGGGTIDSTEGREQDLPLGNLICFRGSVVSQSPLVLDKFEQLDMLSERAQAALAANPDDATALRELAEMKRVEGNLEEAVTFLKRAHELAPEDLLTQEMLAEVLLEVLAKDFSTYRDDLALVRRLIHRQEQEIDLLRLEARGLEQLDERRGALAAYLKLVDLTAGQPRDMKLEASYTVRSDRWISGSLARLWSGSAPEERSALIESIDRYRPTLEDATKPENLREYLAHFGELPDAGELRLELARRLMERSRWEEAELVLLELMTSPSAELQASAAVLLARMDSGSGPLSSAVDYAKLLGSRWADVTALEGLTGEEWAERLYPGVANAEAAGGKPRGRVQASLRPVATPARDRLNRTQVERQFGFRQLPLEQDFGPVQDATQWFIANDASQVVGRSPLGGDILQIGTERNNSERQYRDNSHSQAARLGHLLFLSLGSQVMAIETRYGENTASAEVLWQMYPSGRYPSSRVRRAHRRRDVYHSWSGRENRRSGIGSLAGDLGPATPRGIVIQQQDELKCLDPLTGELLWSRTELPTGCELFGDEAHVIVAALESREAMIFDMVDGRQVDHRRLPPFPWMITAGCNVAHHSYEGSGSGRRLVLRVTDVASGEVILESRYDAHTRLAVVEPKSVAVYEPSGRFQLIDVDAGEVVIDQKLQEVPRPQNLETLVTGDQLFVLVSSDSIQQQLHRTISPDFPLVNGLVYALSLASGEALWPAPAVVRNRGISLGQPSAIPFLVFVDRRLKQDAGGGSTRLRLLCVDKATGQGVYRNDQLPDTAGGRFAIRATRDGASTVTIDMSSRELQLAMTDEPGPPGPPANDDVETRRSSENRGLWGVGRRIGEVLQEALQKPPEKIRARGAPDAAQNLQEFDDD